MASLHSSRELVPIRRNITGVLIIQYTRLKRTDRSIKLQVVDDDDPTSETYVTKHKVSTINNMRMSDHVSLRKYFHIP